MSGILEEILAELKAIRAQSGTAQLTQAVVQPAPTYALDAPIVQPAQPAPAQPAPSNVTSDQILALIQPHIGNDAIKTALGVEMRSMGINALSEAKPHQYGDMFQRFSAVLVAHGIGGAAAPAVQAAPVSII